MKNIKCDFRPYKGYDLEIKACYEDNLLYGCISNIKDIVTFQGTTTKEIYEAFKEAVDDYLDTCKEMGEEPDKPFSGIFNIRTTPDIHRDCVLAAKSRGESLNSWASSTLKSAASRQRHP